MRQQIGLVAILMTLPIVTACPERPNCGTIFVYSASEHRCVCPPGAIDDGGTCVETDAGPPEPCSEGAVRACVGESTGECDPGAQQCTDGAWGPCTGAIEAALETCNGRDDDCDGTIDGDTASATCLQGPRSEGAVCAGGTCRATGCETGLGDCDLDSTNGCESDLATDHDHCGSCGLACSPSEACAERTCVALPALGWERTASGSADVVPHDAAFDGEGNVYVAGVYESTASFEGRSMTAEYEGDVFVASYDPTGTLRWLDSTSGAEASLTHRVSIAVSATGHVAVVGNVGGGAVRFGSLIRTTTAGASGFVALYSSSGSFRRAFLLGESGINYIAAAGFADDGTLIIAGQTDSTSVLHGVTIPEGGFVAKIDPATVEVTRAAAIAGSPQRLVTSGGDVVISGGYGGAVSIGDDVLTARGELDVFVAWCSTDLTCADAVSVGDVGYDSSRTLALHRTGNALVGRSYRSSGAFFESIARTGETAWSIDLGTDTYATASGVITDSTGSAFVVGSFGPEIVLDGTRLVSAGGSDIFVAGLDDDGSVRWADRVGGAASESANGLVGLDDGRAVIYGTRENGRVDAIGRRLRDAFVRMTRLH
jgi:hypothetical protein